MLSEGEQPVSYRRAKSYEEWAPDQPDTTTVSAAEIQPGTVVAWNFKPLLITGTEEINFANWPDSFLESWKEAGEPAPSTWDGRPLYIHNRTDGTNDPIRVGKAPASWRYLVLPKHYAVCSQCGELPPCREAFLDHLMTIESGRLEFEMRLAHGSCHACGQRVTPREHSILFPGDNLIRPDLGVNTAVFHTRRGCMDITLAYQERWLKAEPGRTPRVGQDVSRGRAVESR